MDAELESVSSDSSVNASLDIPVNGITAKPFNDNKNELFKCRPFPANLDECVTLELCAGSAGLSASL